jgi:hypothetical protein
MAPDGHGGLLSLGKLSFSLTRVPSLGIVFLLGWLLFVGTETTVLISGAVYGVALVGFYLLPLRAIHKTMKTAKELELSRISTLFNRLYAQLPTEEELKNQTHPSDGAPKELESLARLVHLHRQAEGMPVWPADATTLRRLCLWISGPLILGLLQLTMEGTVGTWLFDQLR